MANWPTNPDWTPAELINNGIEFTTADGMLASDQNKIIENIIYLFNHITNQHVYVGNVTTVTGEAGTDAQVSIKGRFEDVDENEDGELYLDFTFTIPRGESGPPGPSVASGLAIIPVTFSSWGNTPASYVQRGTYRYVIPAAVHKLGNTPHLVAFGMEFNGTQGYTLFIDNVDVDTDGTVTIYSNKEWKGNILICGGFAIPLEPYILTMQNTTGDTIDSWKQVGSQYEAVIPNDTHGKGQFPIVTCWTTTDNKVNVTSDYRVEQRADAIAIIATSPINLYIVVR